MEEFFQGQAYNFFSIIHPAFKLCIYSLYWGGVRGGGGGEGGWGGSEYHPLYENPDSHTNRHTPQNHDDIQS